ncbi:hypothetical protein BC834DRAFT_1027718 [Gloeopeniophorella convolvens]|nr:hypothetical protein BC834DRAFT_1027718 [Gloeopeniophorella convolvens]
MITRMIGQTWPEYVFIRLSIAALRLIAPLSIGYLAASYHAGAFLWSPFLGTYAIVEAAFFLFVYLPRCFHMQQDAKHPPRLSRAERQALFDKCARSMSSDSVSRWFTSTPGGRVWRDNAVDWVLWALFSAHAGELLTEWEEELDHYVSVLGGFIGYPLDRGNNPAIQVPRLTLDPVVTVHRPFVWYMIVGLVDAAASAKLYHQGFRHYNSRRWFRAFPARPLHALFSHKTADTVTDMPYWYRPHRSRTQLPILFLHGIGIGLWPYTRFMRELAARAPDVGVLAVELLPISMRITAPPLARDALCAALARILDAHGLQRVVVVGHSYGTVVAAHLLRHHELPPSPLWYFASRDPDIARALSRHFFWQESILWREDHRGARPIVDARAVRAYLTGEQDLPDGLEVLYFPTLDHATVLMRTRRAPRCWMRTQVAAKLDAPADGNGDAGAPEGVLVDVAVDTDAGTSVAAAPT